MDEYYMYLRKSRADIEAEALGEMETLARHERILTELARRNNHTITAVFKEIVSGETIADRPQMQRLLAAIQQNNATGVYVMEVERLARGDTKDQGTVAETFKYTNTLIVTPLKTYDPNNPYDEEYFEFGLFMSRREYKTINRRLQTGRLQSAKEGNFIGSIAPYGYDKIRVGKSHTLAPNEDSKYFIMAVDWFLDDHIGATEIANRLNLLGSVPHKASEWGRASVISMLQNPVYAGMIRWNYKKTIKAYEDGQVIEKRPRDAENCLLYPGKHPALITNERHLQIIDRFKSNPRGWGGSEITNPLANLLWCHCGKSMSRRTYSGAGRKYKSAPRYLCGNQTKCGTKSVLVSEMLEAVIQALQSSLNDFELLLHSDQDNSAVKAKDQLIASIKAELAQLEIKENKLYDLLESGTYSETIFLDRREKLLTQRIELQKQLRSEEESKPTMIDYQDRIVRLSDALVALQNDEVPAKRKNDLLRAIIEKIIYYRVDKENFKIEVTLK